MRYECHIKYGHVCLSQISDGTNFTTDWESLGSSHEYSIASRPYDQTWYLCKANFLT